MNPYQWVAATTAAALVLSLLVATMLGVLDDPRDWFDGGAVAEPSPTVTVTTVGGQPGPTDADPQSGEPDVTITETVPAAPVDPAQMSPDEARETLEATYADDRSGFSPDGRWLVQLQSRWEGIQVPGETSRDGDDVFDAADIAISYDEAVAQHGGDVVLLQSTDFGRQVSQPAKPADEPLWVIAYDPGTLSETGAEDWCEGAYPTLSSTARREVCLPRQAVPPHDG